MAELSHFLQIFKKDIAPYYRKHEETFDLESFHGRFHILRCLLLVDKLNQFYTSKGVKLQIEKAYYAVLFHDIARQGNGYDEWENQSSEHCYKYLKSQNRVEDESFQISRLILKQAPFILEGQIGSSLKLVGKYKNPELRISKKRNFERLIH